MACAVTMPGAAASANAVSGMPRRRQAIQAPTPPSAIAPQIPSPPCQMKSAATGFPPGPKYVGQSVATW